MHVDILTADLFTLNAVAHLWGCHLANGFGPILRELVNSVVACRSFSSHEHILENQGQLPEPTDPINFPFIDVAPAP